jgi:hypothetical protein
MVLPLFPVRRGYGAGIRRQGATGAAVATGEIMIGSILKDRKKRKLLQVTNFFHWFFMAVNKLSSL